MWMLLALALAAPRYNADEITLEIAEHTTVELRALARDLLAQQKVRLLTLDGAERVQLFPAKGDGGLASLERPAVLAVLLVAGRKGSDGFEFDLLFADEEGTLRPVTVWKEDAHTVVVVQGDQAPKVPAGPPNAALAKRYGLAGVDQRDAVFEPRVRGAIDQALSLLTEAERARLSDITIIRQGEGSRTVHVKHPPSWVNTATYVLEDQKGRIEVYDDAVLKSVRFVGPVASPRHPTVFILLHELGHAVADAPFRAMLRAHEARRQAFNASLAVFKADQAAYNDAITAFNRSPDKATRAKLDARREALEARHDALERENREIQSLGRDIDREGALTPMARRYGEVIGQRSPTVYGTTSLDEAFAEAFALFHSDPDALKRTVPEAYDWFASGKHLED